MLDAGLRVVVLSGFLLASLFAVGAGRGTAAAEETPAETVTTTLQPGWNLAGWTEDEAEVSAIFEAMPQLDAVYTWDAFKHRFSGAFRMEFGETNRLTTLTPGMGLFLYLGGREAVEWTRPLSARSGATTLRPGWNLVTWVGPDGIATEEALEVLEDVVVEAQGIDSNALTTLRTGSAFWLRVSSLKEWWQLDTPPVLRHRGAEAPAGPSRQGGRQSRHLLRAPVRGGGIGVAHPLRPRLCGVQRIREWDCVPQQRLPRLAGEGVRPCPPGRAGERQRTREQRA